MNYIVFDIETYHPQRIDKIDHNELRTSVTGAYFSWIDKYIAFLEDDIKDFLKLLPKAELIVGYNHVWFDLPVLQKYTDIPLNKLPSYDIMLEIEKRIGYKVRLDDICKANLGEKKTDHYETYKHYYWDNNWYPLIDYCMHDVRLTHELFKIIQNTGTIKYPDLHETREVEVAKPVAGVADIQESAMDAIF